MNRKVKLVGLALLASALLLSNQPAFAGNCIDGGFAKPATCSSSSIRLKGWIYLHRPDGEVVRIKTDQIVFVMSTENTGANPRARSKIQLANGFCDVRETVDEVMQAIGSDYSLV